MGRSCRYRRGSGGLRITGTRVTGAILMIVGALLFLIFVPRWVWTSALGICLISVGYLMWRFGE